jgi:hypothetical protein
MEDLEKLLRHYKEVSDLYAQKIANAEAQSDFYYGLWQRSELRGANYKAQLDELLKKQDG